MIKVNNKQVEFREGITVEEVLKLAGEGIDQMVIVVVDGNVISHIDVKFTTVADNIKISLFRVISGG